MKKTSIKIEPTSQTKLRIKKRPFKQLKKIGKQPVTHVKYLRKEDD